LPLSLTHRLMHRQTDRQTDRQMGIYARMHTSTAYVGEVEEVEVFILRRGKVRLCAKGLWVVRRQRKLAHPVHIPLRRLHALPYTQRECVCVLEKCRAVRGQETERRREGEKAGWRKNRRT
jgi:hypothetical protein